MQILFSLICYVLGCQTCLKDLKTLSGRYCYTPGRVQYMAMLWYLCGIAVLFCDCIWLSSVLSVVIVTVVGTIVYAALEWVLSRLNPKNPWLVWGIRLLVVMGYGLWVMASGDTLPYTPLLFAGLYYRNSPLGVVFPKGLGGLKSSRVQGFKGSSGSNSPSTIQQLINDAEAQGGGVIHLPKGKYFVDGFIQINHSNITLEGEVDGDGNPLTELVCMNPTVNGSRNPWISPFFITTGESLQPSNIFWGLDFRRKQQVVMESSSLSDPGSDGTILTPELATNVTADARKGETILKVENSSKVGKYILLGLYNSSSTPPELPFNSPSTPLIQAILGTDCLRPEWAVANRAVPEEAPSYQWLAEVKECPDEHTVLLATPLLRDVAMAYTPQIYNAPMLENIHIRNLTLSTRWNGLFHHHGLPLYYSVRQAQVMDYGWNGINMKRVAHGSVENVVFENFTNPLYVMDSRECTCEHLIIKGYDGHQGLKMYSHACSNVFRDIRFYAHFADMMGGEGNAYGNLFEDIHYLNPHFNPVDFDFHGFAEGPFSPPADNLFSDITGFRFIKGAGPVTHLPSMAQGNVWENCPAEGGTSRDLQFIHLTYRRKKGLLKFITAVGFTIVMAMKQRRHSLGFLRRTYQDKLASIDARGLSQEQQQQLFVGNYIR